MRLSPHSFNGLLLNTNGITSDFVNPYDWTITGISAVSSARIGKFPVHSAKNYAGQIKVIRCIMAAWGDDRDRVSMALDIEGEGTKPLYALDEFGRMWFVDAVCVGMNAEAVNDAQFALSFSVADPVWKSYLYQSKTFTINGAPETISVDVGGTLQAKPILKLTPVTAGAYGFAYKRDIAVTNRSANPLVEYPVEITDGGLNTAALVAAGKMQADGDDLRVFYKGKEINRWLDGINTATTKIWCNLTSEPYIKLYHMGTIAALGAITTIDVYPTWSDPGGAGGIFLMPQSGYVKIDNEIFSYTGVNSAGSQLTGVTRAALGTAAAAHVAGVWIYNLVANQLSIMYGNATMAAPLTDDTKKPIINLHDSTNTYFVYEEFYDSVGKRTGCWKQRVIVSGNTTDNVHRTRNYFTTEEGADVNPATDAGMSVKAFTKGAVWSSETGYLSWDYYNPIGVTILTVTGKKYRSVPTTTSYFYSAFQKSNIGGDIWANWADVFLETPPTLISTWEAYAAHVNVNLAGTFNYLRNQLYALVPATADGKIDSELNIAYFVLDNTKSPVISSSAEQNCFHMHTTCKNNTTGDQLTLDTVILTESITMDTDAKTILLSNGINARAALQPMNVRKDWLPLNVGANSLTFTDVGVITGSLVWRNRYI